MRKSKKKGAILEEIEVCEDEIAALIDRVAELKKQL